jgi:hypothetical protein
MVVPNVNLESYATMASHLITTLTPIRMGQTRAFITTIAKTVAAVTNPCLTFNTFRQGPAETIVAACAVLQAMEACITLFASIFITPVHT